MRVALRAKTEHQSRTLPLSLAAEAFHELKTSSLGSYSIDLEEVDMRIGRPGITELNRAWPRWDHPMIPA